MFQIGFLVVSIRETHFGIDLATLGCYALRFFFLMMVNVRKTTRFFTKMVMHKKLAYFANTRTATNSESPTIHYSYVIAQSLLLQLVYMTSAGKICGLAHSSLVRGVPWLLGRTKKCNI